MLTEPGEHPVNEETILRAEENLRQVERFNPVNQLGRDMQKRNRAQLERWLAVARCKFEIRR